MCVPCGYSLLLFSTVRLIWPSVVSPFKRYIVSMHAIKIMLKSIMSLNVIWNTSRKMTCHTSVSFVERHVIAGPKSAIRGIECTRAIVEDRLSRFEYIVVISLQQKSALRKKLLFKTHEEGTFSRRSHVGLRHVGKWEKSYEAFCSRYASANK